MTHTSHRKRHTRKHNSHKNHHTLSHIKDAKQQPKTIVVIVHAHWCGACKATMPIWSEFKNIADRKYVKQLDVRNIEETYKDVKIPILENKYLIDGEKVNVSGYPTIFKIVGGHIHYYNGNRTPQEFLQWALKEHYGGFGGVGHTKTDETLILGGVNKTKKHRRTRKSGCSSCDKGRTRRWSWLKFW